MHGDRQALLRGGAPVEALDRRGDGSVPDAGDAEREQAAGVGLARGQPHLGALGEQLLAERRLGDERGALRHDASEPPATVAHQHPIGRVGRAGRPSHRLEPCVVERAVVAAGGLYEQRAPGATLLELVGAGRTALAQVARLVAADVHPPRGLHCDGLPDRLQQLLDPTTRGQPQALPAMVEGGVREMVVGVDEPRQQRAATEIAHGCTLAERIAHLGERPDRRDPSGPGPHRLCEGALRVHRPHHGTRQDLRIHHPERQRVRAGQPSRHSIGASADSSFMTACVHAYRLARAHASPGGIAAR